MADSPKNQILKNTYRIIHQHGPLTKAELLEKTNLKQTTLLRHIYELMDLHLVREKGIEKFGVGRPAVLYEAVPDAGYMIAVDLTRIKTKVKLVNAVFETIEQRSFPMTAEHTPEKTMSEIMAIIDSFLRKHQVANDRLLGIGIGAVGPLDRVQGIILDPESFPAPGWANVPIVKRIKQAFPVRVLLENGANAAVFAEYHRSEQKPENILYCISGEGFRCGVMMNGRLVRTKTGDASAYGHMTIDLNGKTCVCGRKGCLISYVSIHSLREAIRKAQEELGLVDENPGVELMVDKINRGDRVYREAAFTMARCHGAGLGNMINLLHPDLVILSGPLIQGCRDYYEEVVRHARERAYFQDIRFSQGRLGEDAGVLGAAMLVFYSYFDEAAFMEKSF